jgi:hypothetical protein
MSAAGKDDAPQVATGLPPKLAQALQEIVAAESSYVGALRIIVTKFADPLKVMAKTGALEHTQATRILCNVEDIASFHELFLGELRRAAQRGVTEAAEAFLKYADFLKMYTVYVNNYDRCCDTVAELRKNDKFQHFLTQVRQDKACQNNNMMTFLIMPVQRIPQYQLLLENLLKEVQREKTSDRVAPGAAAKLEVALSKVVEIAKYVNENKRRAEDRSKMLDLQQRLSGDDSFTLVTPTRHLLREGELNKESLFRFKASRRIFLFDDIFLWTTSSYKIRGYIDLERAQVVDLAADESAAAQHGIAPAQAAAEGAFEILHPKNSGLVFFAGDEATRKSWVKDIREAIDAAVVRSREMQQRSVRLRTRAMSVVEETMLAQSGRAPAAAAASTPSNTPPASASAARVAAMAAAPAPAAAASASADASPPPSPSPQSAPPAAGSSKAGENGVQVAPVSSAKPATAAGGSRASPPQRDSPPSGSDGKDSRGAEGGAAAAPPLESPSGLVARKTVRDLRERVSLEADLERAEQNLQLLQHERMLAALEAEDPPIFVQLVLEAVSILMGLEGVAAQDADGRPRTDFLRPAVQLIVKPQFVRIVVDHARKRLRVGDERLALLDAYITNPLLEQATIFRYSSDIGYLWQWVRCAFAFQTNTPLPAKRAAAVARSANLPPHMLPAPSASTLTRAITMPSVMQQSGVASAAAGGAAALATSISPAKPAHSPAPLAGRGHEREVSAPPAMQQLPRSVSASNLPPAGAKAASRSLASRVTAARAERMKRTANEALMGSLGGGGGGGGGDDDEAVDERDEEQLGADGEGKDDGAAEGPDETRVAASGARPAASGAGSKKGSLMARAMARGRQADSSGSHRRSKSAKGGPERGSSQTLSHQASGVAAGGKAQQLGALISRAKKR